MPDIGAFSLSLAEWLAVTGLAQSLLILVFIVLRAHNRAQSLPAAAYFLSLALAFGLQLALRLDDYAPDIRLALWAARTLGPPLCVLLVVQMAEGGAPPPRSTFRVLLLVPLAALAAFGLNGATGGCPPGPPLCARLFDWLSWTKAVTGALALLVLWLKGGVFTRMRQVRGGTERYWLSLALVAMNAFSVAVSVARLSGAMTVGESDNLHLLSGLAFVYLATTVLFRVYPPPLHLSVEPRTLRQKGLTPEEEAVAARARELMERDKVYQEPSFSRADLARELGVSESTLSRIINRTFGKSLPQLINAYRVEDAKALLQNPGIAIHVVAKESGFNSVASFNRIFRDSTGITPSAWRGAHLKKTF
jgi:AraC-like DNA-binding protein